METEVHTNRRKKKKKNGSALRVAIIVLLSLILVVGSVFAFLYLRDQYNANLEQSILNATEFHEGVTIGGVDVSGMSPEEAKQALVALEDEIKAGIYFISSATARPLRRTAAILTSPLIPILF